uniref:TetR/AcrR family transcriptional regulator n=1 Tax=Rhodococcus qingshengii TaxID=334542 RepID=UPI001C4DF8D5|nr:TetR/AcrR family transcriptional regulator [Rhodococcus qingshengii]
MARILAAGAHLFDTYGFAAVTTQKIAECADIGTGTLFQYVESKNALLVMVHNQRFAEAVRKGWVAQELERGLRCRVMALVEPVVRCSRHNVENGRTYLHEVIAGDPAEPSRAHANEIVHTFERHIEHVLIDCGVKTDGRATASAHMVFAVIFIELSRATTEDQASDRLLANIDNLLAAHFEQWTEPNA